MTKPIDPAAFAGDTPATDADLAGEAPTAAEPSAADPSATAAPVDDPAAGIPFDPVRTRARHDGWSAARQRIFIDALAATGSVTRACAEAGASPRSAYRLRMRPDAASFAYAWDHALTLGVRHLVDVAIERAVRGVARGVWHEGSRVGEEYVPSDRLLMFLLANLLPTRFGKLTGILPCAVPDSVLRAEERLPLLAERFTDAAPADEADRHERFTPLADLPGEDPAPRAQA